MEQKNWWQRFNPSLKDMQEKNPKLTILGIWWAQLWRVFIIEFVVMFAFIIFVGFFTILIGLTQH